MNKNFWSGFCCITGPTNARERCQRAFRIRLDAALYQKGLPLANNSCAIDDDQEFFCDEASCLAEGDNFAHYAKGLPHDHLGVVDTNAYKDMISALYTGNPEDLEAIPLGGVNKLVNPQAAYAFELVGADSHHLSMAAPPDFSSAQTASEMAELYWQALARDVSFADYHTNQITLSAAADLSKFTDYRGPKVKGRVTAATLFRGDTPGDLVGPYLSQFLWQNIPFGATRIVQQYRTTMADDDHITEYQEWLNIQNGLAPITQNQFDPLPRYIRNGRDMAEWVHQDFSFQGALSACLILMGYGTKALNQTNPYLYSKTQVGFSNFGSPHIIDFVTRSTRAAFQAAWFQKWLIFNRIRPEEFGGRVHNLLTGSAKYPINPELLNSQAIANIFNKYNTYLLPMAYPEGCPTHPAYPAGHACMIGAGVTMMKAFFREGFVIPNPVVASSDGLSLLPYSGEPLTIGGELNKLAANIAFGRNFAGVHWRSDGIEGLKLGEAVTIGILQDYGKTYHENFPGFTFTKFDGTRITV